ncbi:MAG: hypothetical protein J5714_04820 [Alphaproteobacteria bacterium]|nr:hypothetical protein [Alphaproteobacteria bacterium]
MLIDMKYKLLEIKDDIGDLWVMMGFWHSACVDVRKKRSAARIAKAHCGTDYEMAMKRLDIAKSWRRSYLRSLLGLKKK